MTSYVWWKCKKCGNTGYTNKAHIKTGRPQGIVCKKCMRKYQKSLRKGNHLNSYPTRDEYCFKNSWDWGQYLNNEKRHEKELKKKGRWNKHPLWG